MDGEIIYTGCCKNILSRNLFLCKININLNKKNIL